jgi:hypothetical protein
MTKTDKQIIREIVSEEFAAFERRFQKMIDDLKADCRMKMSSPTRQSVA